MNLSLTQILHLLAGDTLDLRSMENSNGVFDITLCLYLAPAPYGLWTWDSIEQQLNFIWFVWNVFQIDFASLETLSTG